MYICKGKGKVTPLQAGVAQRVGRGIAILFHDRGTRRGWVVSSTPRAHFTPGKDPVPILQEAWWAPGPVWIGAGNLVTTGIRFRTVQPAASRYSDWDTRPIYIYIYIYICVYIYTHAHTYAHARTYIYICMYMCVCVCIYIYIYIHIHMHTHVRTHTHTHTLFRVIKQFILVFIPISATLPCVVFISSCKYFPVSHLVVCI